MIDDVKHFFRQLEGFAADIGYLAICGVALLLTVRFLWFVGSLLW